MIVTSNVVRGKVLTMEHWKPVVGYEGAYEVSDTGVVRSLDRTTPHAFIGEHTRHGKTITPRPTTRGHWAVRLFRGGRSKQYLVHRLVLEAFVGPCPPGCVLGLHRDDNPLNNTPANLYWGTHADNARDRLRNGRYPNARKTVCKYGHSLTGDNVRVLKTPTGTARRCRECERRNAREFKRARSGK